jgi:hypothetical protein
MLTENDDGAGPVIGDRRKAGQDEPDPVSHAPGDVGSKPDAIGGEADGLDRVGRDLG